MNRDCGSFQKHKKLNIFYEFVVMIVKKVDIFCVQSLAFGVTISKKHVIYYVSPNNLVFVYSLDQGPENEAQCAQTSPSGQETAASGKKSKEEGIFKIHN